MLSPHGLMWSSSYQPDKPKVRKRVDWKRIGALFAPYWKQQSAVLACIVLSAVIGKYLFAEQISWQRWAGMLLIVGGISLVGMTHPRTRPTSRAAAAGVAQ